VTSADRSATLELYRRKGLAGRVGFGRRPALLVVDLSRGFTDPASPLGANLDREIAAVQALLGAARAAKIPIHFTTIAYGPAESGAFMKKIPSLAMLREGSAAVAIDPRVAPQDGEKLWTKKGASAFFGTALAAALVAQAVDTVILAGATTSGCVRASAIDACQHDFRAILVPEAVGDRAAGPHEANLLDIDAKYADVVPLELVVKYLGEIAGTHAKEGRREWTSP
jgi:maleamate amidohydrolase